MVEDDRDRIPLGVGVGGAEGDAGTSPILRNTSACGDRPDICGGVLGGRVWRSGKGRRALYVGVLSAPWDPVEIEIAAGGVCV